MFAKNNDEENINKIIQKAIIKTVAYFDMFDYPLTDFEVWKFLHANAETHCNASLREIKNVLKGVLSGSTASKAVEPLIETKNGFYFLKGRENIIRIRLERYNFMDRKMKHALRVAKIYRLIPWVKMIAVANVIGAHNLKDESDIDFFIISEKGRVWLTRFFTAGFAKVLGLRPSERNARDKICLNFYVSEEAMDLEKFMLNNTVGTEYYSVPKKNNDIYFIYWLANLIPIYEKDEMYKKFIQANGWLKNYLPNWQPVLASGRRRVKSGENKVYDAMINLIFGHLEKILKNIQLKLMPKEIKELANKDSRVVINDNILKLHVKDRREEYRNKWEDKIKSVIKEN